MFDLWFLDMAYDTLEYTEGLTEKIEDSGIWLYPQTY